MLFAQRCLSVKNKIAIFFFFLIFIMMQVVILFYFIFESKKTISLQCMSSFTRNTKEDESVFYSGKIMLSLNKEGKGNLVIDGKTDEELPKKFHYAYFFNYHIADDGELKTIVTSVSSGVSNEISDKIFRKDFIELNFRIKGGVHIHKFGNVYILNTPGFIVGVCAPV